MDVVLRTRMHIEHLAWLWNNQGSGGLPLILAIYRTDHAKGDAGPVADPSIPRLHSCAVHLGPVHVRDDNGPVSTCQVVLVNDRVKSITCYERTH